MTDAALAQEAGRPLGVAIVGCGWAGGRHAAGYDRAGAEVRWAIDSSMARAESVARGRGSIISDDFRQALADPHVEAVDVCLPHNLHAPVAIEAARTGKHVLVEKPLATTLDEADSMIVAAERASVTLMVAENVRFDPVYRRVRQLLDDGVIGRPALIQVTRQAYLRSSFLRDRPWFLSREAAAGGIMTSGGVHDFETMRMLIGEIESVYALRAPQRFSEMEGDDTSIAAVKFRDGAVGTLVESFIMKSLVTASGPEVHTLRIDGDLGSIAVEDGRTIRLFSEREDLQIGGALAEHDLHVPEADTYQLEIAHFLDCIRTGAEPITSGTSQRAPVAAVLAAYRSMETGLPEPVERRLQKS